MTSGRRYEWILLVEDDRDASNAYAAALKEGGFKTVQAYSVQEANSKLLKQKFRAVILDLHLAQRSGEQVIAHMRIYQGLNEQTPVLVISGYLEPEAIRRLKPQVQGMLVKPFDTKDFLDRLKATIHTPVPPASKFKVVQSVPGSGTGSGSKEGSEKLRNGDGENEKTAQQCRKQ